MDYMSFLAQHQQQQQQAAPLQPALGGQQPPQQPLQQQQQQPPVLAQYPAVTQAATPVLLSVPQQQQQLPVLGSLTNATPSATSQLQQQQPQLSATPQLLPTQQQQQQSSLAAPQQQPPLSAAPQLLSVPTTQPSQPQLLPPQQQQQQPPASKSTLTPSLGSMTAPTTSTTSSHIGQLPTGGASFAQRRQEALANQEGTVSTLVKAPFRMLGSILGGTAQVLADTVSAQPEARRVLDGMGQNKMTEIVTVDQEAFGYTFTAGGQLELLSGDNADAILFGRHGHQVAIEKDRQAQQDKLTAQRAMREHLLTQARSQGRQALNSAEEQQVASAPVPAARPVPKHTVFVKGTSTTPTLSVQLSQSETKQATNVPKGLILMTVFEDHKGQPTVLTQNYSFNDAIQTALAKLMLAGDSAKVRSHLKQLEGEARKGLMKKVLIAVVKDAVAQAQPQAQLPLQKVSFDGGKSFYTVRGDVNGEEKNVTLIGPFASDAELGFLWGARDETAATGYLQAELQARQRHPHDLHAQINQGKCLGYVLKGPAHQLAPQLTQADNLAELDKMRARAEFERQPWALNKSGRLGSQGFKLDGWTSSTHNARVRDGVFVGLVEDPTSQIGYKTVGPFSTATEVNEQREAVQLQLQQAHQQAVPAPKPATSQSTPQLPTQPLSTPSSLQPVQYGQPTSTAPSLLGSSVSVLQQGPQQQPQLSSPQQPVLAPPQQQQAQPQLGMPRQPQLSSPQQQPTQLQPQLVPTTTAAPMPSLQPPRTQAQQQPLLAPPQQQQAQPQQLSQLQSSLSAGFGQLQQPLTATNGTLVGLPPTASQQQQPQYPFYGQQQQQQPPATSQQSSFFATQYS